MTHTSSLATSTQRTIVLVALLQGLLLYLADTGQQNGWWPFVELGGRVCWYTLVLGVPTVMNLSVLRLDDRRYWQQSIGVFLALIPLACWAAWSATGAPGLDSEAVLMPYGMTTALALFVALPYLQARLQHGRWLAPYPELFETAWQNGLTLALAGLFTGICWGVLQLWAELFHLIGIDFFKETFQRRPFVYLATGTMVGLGILIGRTQQRPIQIARQVVLAIFTGLLPLLAVIAVLFVISLPFTGLDALWNTRYATAVLMWVIALLVLFTNAVLQDGRQAAPYPRWLQRVVELGLLCLPVYAAIGCYALSLRIGQYGWTSDRLFAAIGCLLLGGYALGYAGSVLRTRGGWLNGLPRVNVVLSIVAIVLVVLVNSPLLDPHRIAVNDRVARWSEQRIQAKDLDPDYLRFQSGRRGYAALQDLQSDPLVIADPKLAQQLQQVVAKPRRWTHHSAEEIARDAPKNAAAWRERIQAVDPSLAIDETFLSAVAAADNRPIGCDRPDGTCLLLSRDLDSDGRSDLLLCGLQDHQSNCQLWVEDANSWRGVGTFTIYSNDAAATMAAIRNGEISLLPRRWPDLEVNGQRLPFVPSENDSASMQP